MSDAVKELLKTLAWIVAVVIICSFGFMFLMRGAMELAQEYKTFSGAAVSNSNQSLQPSQNSAGVFAVPTSTATTTGWTRYVSPTNDFAVAFPHYPEVETHTESRAVLHIHRAYTQNETFEVHRVTSFQPIQDITAKDLELFVEGLAQSQDKRIESVYVDTRAQIVRFALQGNQENRSVVRGVLVPIDKVNLYVLQYSCDYGTCNETRYTQFVSSFTTER